MKLCKGIECKKYGAIYENLYFPNPNTGRWEKKIICKKRSCFHGSNCWRGDIDVIIEIFKMKRRLKRQQGNLYIRCMHIMKYERLYAYDV